MLTAGHLLAHCFSLSFIRRTQVFHMKGSPMYVQIGSIKNLYIEKHYRQKRDANKTNKNIVQKDETNIKGS